jgi:hypothetical protein
MGVRGGRDPFLPRLIGVVGVLVAPLVLSTGSSAKVSFLRLFDSLEGLLSDMLPTSVTVPGESRRDTTLNTDSVDPAIGVRTKDLGPALDEGACDSSICANVADGCVVSSVGEGPGCRLRWANTRRAPAIQTHSIASTAIQKSFVEALLG